MNDIICNRYEFVLFFDVTDGNPNGDPDAGNLPRVDSETGHGLITDVCLKRKLRNYVQLAKGCAGEHNIFVKEKAILNKAIESAHDKARFIAKEERDKSEAARQIMCSRYFDVRTFGAVMTTGKNAGQVRGPVQLTFSRSVDPVIPIEHTIIRIAVTTEAESAKQLGYNQTIGRKFTIPYALYRCHGYISACLAAQTGFGSDDLELLWEALGNMFEHDHSAARGQMSTRKLIVFKHNSKMGNAPAHKVFEMVRAEAIRQPPRAFSDYRISVPDQSDVPSGVEIIEKT